MRAQVVQWEDDNEALPHATVRDAFLTFPIPPVTADPQGWGVGCVPERLTQWLRLWLPRLLVIGLTLAALHPRAYDAEKMLAAAQKQQSGKTQDHTSNQENA